MGSYRNRYGDTYTFTKQEDGSVLMEGKFETGYLIKTIPHEYDPNDMSHLADTKIIGGIINTTE